MASGEGGNGWIDWLMPVVVLAVWFVLARWVLPRMGVPT
jgi:hypothetical protein